MASSASADRIDQTSRILLAIILVAAVVTPFVAWNASSLWGDELFSLYFSDPTVPAAHIVGRALEDVHPPGYYLILYFLRRSLSGDPVLVGRVFSALCAVGSLLILALACRRHFSTTALLFTLVGASLSLPYFSQSVEIRSYALCFLLVSSMISFVQTKALIPSSVWLLKAAVFTLFLVACSFVHYYLVFVSLSICFYLCVTSSGRHEALFWVIAAISVIGVSMALLHWHHPHIINNLRVDGPRNLRIVEEIKLGVTLFARSPLILLLLGLAVFIIPWRSAFSQLVSAPRRAVSTPFGLAVTGSFGPILAATAYTLMIEPVFSARLFTVIAPFFWLGAGALFQNVIMHDRREIALPILLMGAVWSSGRLVDHFRQINTDFRASAHAIESGPGCLTEAIAVTGYRQKYISADEASTFYDHYTHGDPRRFKLIRAGQSPGEVAAKVLAVVGGGAGLAARHCPVLLWDVTAYGRDQMREMASLLVRSSDFPRQCGIRLRAFPPAKLTGVFDVPRAIARSRPALPGDIWVAELQCPGRPLSAAPIDRSSSAA